MPNIHELLDNSQKHCQALVEEMKAFKQAKSLNQKAAESLDATCVALNNTAKAIQPFTEERFRKFLMFLAAMSILNTVLFLAIVLMLFYKK